MKYFHLNRDYKVVCTLPMEGIGQQLEERKGSYSAEYGPNVIASLECPSGRRFDLINKIFPHSAIEAMIMDSSDDYRHSLFQYSKDDQIILVKRIVDIIRRAERIARDSHNRTFCIVAAMNFDPYTNDRASIMTDKRFHCHVMLHGEDTIQKAVGLTTSVAEVQDIKMLNRLIDPISISLIQPFYQYIMRQNEEMFSRVMKPSENKDVELGLPIGIKIELSQIDELASCQMMELLNNLHLLYDSFYQTWFSCIYGMDYQSYDRKDWYRPEMKSPIEALDELLRCGMIEDHQKDEAMFILRELQNMGTEVFSQDTKEARSRMLLNGPAYSITITGNGKVDEPLKWYLSFYPKYLSDLGGAGMTSFAGINAIRIKRNSGMFAEKILEKRMDFLSEIKESWKGTK